MAFTLLDAAEAARRRRSASWKPGDLIEFAPVIPRQSGLRPDTIPAPTPPPQTSTAQPSGTLPQRAPGPDEYAALGLPTPAAQTPDSPQAPARSGFFTKDRLLSALQGASAGIQANVGPAVSGQEFSQGLLKGIVGAGTVAAARAREEAAEDRSGQTLTDKLALLEARRRTPEQIEDEAAARARGRLPFDLQRLQASSEAQVERVKRVNALAQSSGKSEDELRDLRKAARAQAFRELDATVNLNRPENANLLDILTEQLYESYLKTDPRPSGFGNIKRQ